MEKVANSSSSSTTAALVEVDQALLSQVAGGLPRGTWSETLALPRGTWSEIEALPRGTWESALPRGTW